MVNDFKFGILTLWDTLYQRGWIIFQNGCNFCWSQHFTSWRHQITKTLLKWEYILTGMCYWFAIFHVECPNCTRCTEIHFFSKMAHKFDDFIIFVKCWCQQKLKLEYLLIGICYCLEILQTGGPVSTLSNKIKIFSTWGIYVMTSSFFWKKSKNDDVIKNSAIMEKVKCGIWRTSSSLQAWKFS